VHEILIETLRRQQSAGFPDLAGGTASATIPIGDRLINELIARSLPSAGPVREVQIESQEGNRIKVTLRVAAGGLTLPFNVRLLIDEQPALPHRPILALRLTGVTRLLSMAGPSRFLDVLPPGISVDGDRILVNVELLLAHYGRGDLIRYLTGLTVTSAPHKLLVSISGGV
jgi:hypothetical protein